MLGQVGAAETKSQSSVVDFAPTQNVGNVLVGSCWTLQATLPNTDLMRFGLQAGSLETHGACQKSHLARDLAKKAIQGPTETPTLPNTRV